MHAVAELKRLGMRTYLWTSDSGPAVERIARDLEIDAYETGLSAAAKRARLQRLRRERRVAFVHDGSSEDPLIVPGAVRVIFGSVADAHSPMNAVMIGDDLRGFADVVRLARRTRLIIWTNVIGTVAIDW
jgi:cation transport ATPase